MPEKPPKPAATPPDQQPNIDTAVELLIKLLREAVDESRHGLAGVTVSIHDGEIRTFRETREFTIKAQ